MNTSSTALARVLTERFDAAAAADLDVIVGFAWPALASTAPAPTLRCSIRAGDLEILKDDAPCEPDFTLYFRDEAHAIALLSAAISPIDAFMAGEFRSSGYIVWSFRTLAAFT
jgi:hypothetical protein